MKINKNSKEQKIIGKCEGCLKPIGMDNPIPELSWSICEPGLFQKSFKVLVYKDAKTVWETEFMHSNQTRVLYEGTALEDITAYTWQIVIETVCGKNIQSEMFKFVTGYLDISAIQAKWIEYPLENDNPVFYSDFYCDNDLEQAYVVISGLGYYEMKINKTRAHDTYNVPGWSDYSKRDFSGLLYPYRDNSEKRVLYNVLDITNMVNKGANRYEVMLGNGFFNQVERGVEGDLSYGTPRLLMEIHLLYNNRRKIFITDDTIFCTQGPLTFNNIYFGEIRNDNIGMSFNGESTAVLCNWEHGGLEAVYGGFDYITETIEPKTIDNDIYDVGKNTSGRVKINAQGPRGAEFKIIYFDAIDSEGNPDFKPSGGEWQIQENKYIFGENEEIEYAETFGWRGFRYFTIEKDIDIDILDIRVEVIHPKPNINNYFITDNEIVNGIHKAFINSQLSNMHSGVPSDCPHRERLGYTGDGQVVADAALFAIGNLEFYKKWIRDIALSQNEDTGFVPHTVPFYGGGGGPAWGSACAIVPWSVYTHNFDVRILAQNYEVITKWIQYLEGKSVNYIVEKEEEGSWCLGDWCMPVNGYNVEDVDVDYILQSLDPKLVNTCYFYHCSKIAVDFGKVLGRDTLYFERLCERIKKNFNDEFFDVKTGRYTDSKFYPNVYPLYFEMVPEKHIEQVVSVLVEDVIKNDYAMKTGIFATSMIFNVLADNDKTDVIENMLEKKEYPSFGYMLNKGATTLWETWDGKASLNHPMFGGVCSFFYRYIAGIRYISSDKMFIIQPLYLKTINKVNASYDSVYGQVKVNWERKTTKEGSSQVSINVTLSGNTKGVLKIEDKIFKIDNGFYKYEFNE